MPKVSFYDPENIIDEEQMLYLAEITELGPLPEAFEIEKIQFFDELPKAWTYPDIQPLLLKKAEEALIVTV